MDYRDYKTASERHLETCLKLKEQTVNNYVNKTLQPNELKVKNEILGNIYYLSGYIIECIVNYGMLVYIDFDKICKKEKISSVHDLKLTHNKAKISYSSNSDKNAKYYLWQTSHKQFERNPNIYFFDQEAKIQGSEIDLIKSKLNNQNIKGLFKNWCVKSRYTINPIILNGKDVNETAVFDFLDFAQLVNSNLTNHIIPKL
jgi:hypothetical protein